MRIANTYHTRGVDAGAIRNQAARCGLDPDEAIHRTHALAERVRDAVAALGKEGWDTTILESTGTMIQSEPARRVLSRKEWVRIVRNAGLAETLIGRRVRTRRKREAELEKLRAVDCER